MEELKEVEVINYLGGPFCIAKLIRLLASSVKENKLYYVGPLYMHEYMRGSIKMSSKSILTLRLDDDV
jgi:hypothetical protein